MMDKYWILWASGNCIGTVKHLTIESAKIEADRILRNNGRGTVHILECIGKIEFESQPVVYIETTQDYLNK